VEIVDMLERTPLFSELTKRDLSSIADTARTRDYASGEVIVKEGGEGTGCYIISSGAVEVVKGADTPNANVLTTLGPGDFFGEMSILDHHPRFATVRAKDDTVCIVITRWDFNAALEDNPKIALRILPVIVRRLREAENKAMGQ